MLRYANASDTADIAKIHVSAMPKDLLPSLGVSFLRKTFIPACLRDNNTFILIHHDDTVLTSFAVFSKAPQAITKDIMARKINLLAAVLKKLVVTPSFIKILIGYLCSYSKIVNPPTNDIDSYPEIYTIASHPEHIGKGYGTSILAEGLQILKTQKAPGCLVRTASQKAKTFYLKNNFKFIGQEHRGSTILDILLYEFS